MREGKREGPAGEMVQLLVVCEGDKERQEGTELSRETTVGKKLKGRTWKKTMGGMWGVPASESIATRQKTNQEKGMLVRPDFEKNIIFNE